MMVVCTLGGESRLELFIKNGYLVYWVCVVVSHYEVVPLHAFRSFMFYVCPELFHIAVLIVSSLGITMFSI